jgi:hypothetical protein
LESKTANLESLYFESQNEIVSLREKIALLEREIIVQENKKNQQMNEMNFSQSVEKKSNVDTSGMNNIMIYRSFPNL